MSVVKMLGKRVLIKLDEPTSQVGDFLLSKSTIKPSDKGTVVLVSEEITTVQKDDRVLVQRINGNSCIHDGVEHAIFMIDQLEAVID